MGLNSGLKGLNISGKQQTKQGLPAAVNGESIPVPLQGQVFVYEDGYVLMTLTENCVEDFLHVIRPTFCV
jgi:hypothetical protein